ncbi:MAG: hypothetical protein AABZ11_02305 [Nitrospinota bacterium]
MVHKALYNISMILVVLALVVIANFVHGTAITAQEENVVVTATGQGYASENLKGTRQGNELARRAAIADAYRNMAKKLYGSEAFEKGDILVESVNGLVKGAKVTKEECRDGGCEVEITLTYKNVLTTYSEVLSDAKQLANCKSVVADYKAEMERLKSQNKAFKKQVADLNKKLKDAKIRP